jgi:uncharacterized membrane protein (UPF0136 family)
LTVPARTAVSSPPRTGWSSRVFSLPVLLGLLLLLILFSARASRNLADPDIWWHLRNAFDLLHSGHFVRVDSWTFTVAGQPRVNFEWLAELGLYGAWQHLGSLGLYWEMMLLSSAILLGVFGLCWMRSRDWIASFLAALVALEFSVVSLAPRTLLCGWLFLVIELAILWGVREGRDHTAWLPPLFCLWINTHGSWFIGFVLMILFFACGWIQGEWGRIYAVRWPRQQTRKFLLVTLASCAALAINPYGWRLMAYPFDVAFRQKGTLKYITEWASLNLHTSFGKEVLAVLLGFAVLQLLRPRRWPLHDLLFAIIAVYGAFAYVRFVYLAGILIAPLLAMDLKFGIAPDANNPPRRMRWAFAFASAMLLALTAAEVPNAQQLQTGIAAYFPEQAVPFLQTLAGKGNLFNEFNWGGYLEWEVPQVKTFIDPRVDIFIHHGVMQDYAQAVDGQNTFAVLDKYRIRYALLRQGSPMAWLLEHTSGWTIAWQDPKAVILERAQPLPARSAPASR